VSVKEFEEREKERRDKEQKEKEKAVNSHDRPDVPPDKTPDVKPQGEVARRDPESKKLRDEQLARADGHGGKTEKKLDNMEKKQASHEKARESREQDRQRDERSRERDR
jgi:hypothetical protein